MEQIIAIGCYHLNFYGEKKRCRLSSPVRNSRGRSKRSHDILAVLMEVGGNHAQSVGFLTDGFDTTPTMRKLHLIWVTAPMHVEQHLLFLPCVLYSRVDLSKWVMMNQDTRPLQKVSDDLKEECLIFCPPETSEPRRGDLDINQHVNNVTYIGWALESMPEEIIDTHELQTITVRCG
ncbi:Cysteine-rich RLK (RECEPTOR-like protein kinase) 8 [Hibiscus syriacus]|uniref:Cysteine-rich RLK (RECEPTOR-like protein kinase) 8 n=1 Tax=Hibiscus syriacus TaxID=106335 RepID=A0A6A2YYE3_HIBSY|nr:Cysteine-rich RLK (RECEPTOR-like protein kinase) 8 [Hibiscus syriacus]